MTNPQPLDLDVIQARLAAATPGPWWNDSHEIYQGERDDTYRWIGETCNIDHQRESDANGAFIAHARQDIPALLAEVTRLRTERDQFADRVDTLTAVAKSNTQAYKGAVQECESLRTELATYGELFETAGRVLASSSYDWSGNSAGAWLYGVVNGWDCARREHDETCVHGAMEETATRHGWDAETVATIRRFRAAITHHPTPTTGSAGRST